MQRVPLPTQNRLNFFPPFLVLNYYFFLISRFLLSRALKTPYMLHLYRNLTYHPHYNHITLLVSTEAARGTRRKCVCERWEGKMFPYKLWQYLLVAAQQYSEQRATQGNCGEQSDSERLRNVEEKGDEDSGGAAAGRGKRDERKHDAEANELSRRQWPQRTEENKHYIHLSS